MPQRLGPSSTVEEIRSRFPVLDRATYLSSCSLGALSDRAEGRLAEFLAEWHAFGASAWYDRWLGRLEELRGRVARFLGADPGELALLPSTSTALSVVAESVDYGVRSRVVTTELDFPTIPHQWAVKPEVEVVVLRSPDGVRILPEQFAEAVDERTAFLATSHVFFTTGFRQDPAALARIARAAGAHCLMDGYQAAGQIAVDVKEAGVDAYTAGPLKWLCGGPGLAYLYVRRELTERWEPRITSWLAGLDPFGFDPEGFAYRPDAGRFEMGTPALATVHTALGGQELVEEVGIRAIEERNRALTRQLVEGLEAEGFRLRISPDPATRTAIVMADHPRPDAAVSRLAEEGIIVDHRVGHVRISPHFYNTEREMDRVVEALARTER